MERWEKFSWNSCYTNASRAYMDNGSVEAAKNAVREKIIPAGHPAFRIRLYDSENATVANTEVKLWTAATIENIVPIKCNNVIYINSPSLYLGHCDPHSWTPYFALEELKYPQYSLLCQL